MKIVEADTFFKKLKGLMFKKDFNYVMKFKSNGIHTFFMKTNIDVYLTDKDYKILYIYRNLKPNKIILPKRKIKYTFETPTDYLKDVKIYDYFIKCDD